jgi:serine/threonine protein kinase
MQHVDQYNSLSYCYPQLPSELRSQFAVYAPSPIYPSTIAADGCNGRITPLLNGQGAFPRGFPSHQLPTPPPSPPSFGHDDSFDIHHTSRKQHQYADYNTSSSWSNYLDPGHRLQFQRVLGSGAYGIVHLAKDISTGIHYAVKALNKVMPNGLPLDLRQQQFQQTEMRLHYQVSAHPNIVSLLRIMDTREHTYVIMEYCPEGDLFSNITERGRYVGDDDAAKHAFLQILDAVSHCHRLGIYHRDLKPENILVTQGGHQVKLADFGLATTEPYATEFGCGSTFYMSPECQDQSSGKAYYACAPNDIWSLGVILVNLTCGRNPWKSASPKDSTFRAYMEDRHFLKSILPLSDELNDILGMIFELDPTRRIKLDELRQRILNCHQFTKPQVPATTYANSATYEETLSPSSTISDEGSMISDHSDDSTVPSELDSSPEDDFSSFEVMEEDCDFNLDQGFQCHVPDASPTPKVISKVWEAASICSVEGSQEPSLNTYVPAMSKPFDYGSAGIPALAEEVPSIVCREPEKPVDYRSSTGYSAMATEESFTGPVITNTGIAPTSKRTGPTHQVSTEYATAARWAKRSFPRDRPNFRGLNQWQLRYFVC